MGVIIVFFQIIDMLLGFIEFMMTVYGIVSLLVFFGVLNPYGRFTRMVWLNMQGLFEPMLRPIRRFVPSGGGFDWSFLILFLFIEFTRRVIHYYMAQAIVGAA
ncbi:MAG TPA: YggT family protein [Alphaproteobacteria bacterium]|nr:YggT family protein [Alphaproteobacteria bacterium]